MQPSALQQIDRYIRHLEIERRASPHTIDAYGRDLAAFRSYCELEKVGTWMQLQTPHVRGFAARSHRDGIAPRSIGRRLSTVRSFLRFLVREGVIRSNPAEGVLPPKWGKHRLPDTLTVDQMEKLLTITDTDFHAIRDKAIMELLYSSGLRLAELTGLNVADFDPRDQMVKVIGKGSKERIVPVGKQALAAIQRWLLLRRKTAKQQELALFVGRYGERLTPRAVQLRIAYWGREQLAMRVHPHQLRHSCATHFLEGSGALREVGELLGHASLATTALYTHLDFAHLAATYYAKHPRAGRKPPEALTPQVLARIEREST